MSEDSLHVDLTMTSESEPDGHPADEMIISKAAKRAAAKRQVASIPDADAPASEHGQQPKKKRKRKKPSPAADAEAAADDVQSADASSPAVVQLQQEAASAGGKARSSRPRKASAAAMLSPDNAQQLQRQSPAAVPSPGAATAVQPPPGLETASETVRADPEDAAVLRTPAPLGVIVVDDDDTPAPNSEVQRLLRAPRYFDEEGFENAAMRCYRCGGSGHKAQDCTNEAKARPCALCAQFGHSKANCPSLVCFKCNRTGHVARDCTYSYGSRVADAASAVCLRCGLSSCRGAQADWARAEGACTTRHSAADLALAVCFVCGRRGHLCCASTPAATYRPSCYNCGEGGHTAPECRREKPIAVRNERQPGYSERSVTASYYGYDDDYGGYNGYGGSSYGGGGASAITCYACGESGHMARDCPNQHSKSKDRGRSRFAAADTNGRNWRQTQLPSWQHDRR